MAQIVERTILFADLRGSTSLYETLGTTDASAVVTQSVALLARVVVACGGHVVKTLGDGLLAMFLEPEAAVDAADEMHDSMERIGSPGTTELARAARKAPTMKLQVAVAVGDVVELEGDVFGDAVNVAARLLDHAGDNETLVTHAVLQGLEAEDRSRFRSLDRIQLRGRVEPVHVHLLEGKRRFGDTAATAYGDLAPVAEPEAIRLIWAQMNRIYAGARLPVLLGRSPQATYCIDDSRVSRLHARIDWHGGTFQLTDLSFNGTYVRFDNDPEVIALRRGGCTLHGSGVIGLGAALTEAECPTVRFEVMRFADTQPQGITSRG
jgi:class 3 adenylate cyclase